MALKHLKSLCKGSRKKHHMASRLRTSWTFELLHGSRGKNTGNTRVPSFHSPSHCTQRKSLDSAETLCAAEEWTYPDRPYRGRQSDKAAFCPYLTRAGLYRESGGATRREESASLPCPSLRFLSWHRALLRWHRESLHEVERAKSYNNLGKLSIKETANMVCLVFEGLQHRDTCVEKSLCKNNHEHHHSLFPKPGKKQIFSKPLCLPVQWRVLQDGCCWRLNPANFSSMCLRYLDHKIRIKIKRTERTGLNIWLSKSH